MPSAVLVLVAALAMIAGSGLNPISPASVTAPSSPPIADDIVGGGPMTMQH